jgi:hypothetical protein
MKLPSMPKFFNTAMKHDPIKDNLIDYHENLHKKFRWTPKNTFKILGFLGVILASHEFMIASMVLFFIFKIFREILIIQELQQIQLCFSFSEKVKENIKFFVFKKINFILIGKNLVNFIG